MKILHLIACSSLFICLTLFSAVAVNAADQLSDQSVEPLAAVKNVVDTVLNTLKNPAYADPITRPPLRRHIEAAVKEGFDFSEFSARTVGVQWKNFSDSQKQRFTDAFADLLMTTYLDNINGYNGEKVEYTGEKRSSKGNRSEIASIVTLIDGKKIPVDYRLMHKNNIWVVYDIIIENVSLIKNYRAQFKEIMAKGNAEMLIERVRERAASLMQKKAD